MLNLRVSIDGYLTTCFERQSSPHVSELAISLDVSRSTLSEHFREEHGRSLGSYLKERQIEYAAQLLRETDLTIAEVARRSAFGSERSFYRTFRRFTDTTPSAYRRVRQNVSRHGLQ
jgi:AraC-like DNA-binding protein